MWFLKSRKAKEKDQAHRLPAASMVATNEDGTEVVYSPYYELRHHSDDGALLAQIVVTSGHERVPPNYQHTGPFADDLVEAYENGIVEQVMETYFSNKSNAAVTVRLRCVEFLDKRLDVDFPFEVPARNRSITPGIITLGSNYGIETPVKIAYEYAGKRYDVDGWARRIPADELKNLRFGETGA